VFTVTIITVGRKSDVKILSLCDEYEKRLQHECKVVWKVIEPETGKMSLQEQKDRESQKILLQIANTDVVILLDEKGHLYDNYKLAGLLDEVRQNTGSITIIIGGAFGVSENLAQRANYTWSLSRLVFPHELVRLLLVEQLYRTISILNGGKYHHE
jgi:23S rRNA (pseudouridine1915-N3)-methyltransferase